MNYALAGKVAVVLCLLFWHPAFKRIETLVFRFKLRREILRARKDWAKGYQEWHDKRAA